MKNRLIRKLSRARYIYKIYPNGKNSILIVKLEKELRILTRKEDLNQ